MSREAAANGITDGWTDAEDAVIEAGLAEGLGDRDIAARLKGRTPKAVKGRRHRLGLSRGAPAVIDRDRLVELYAAGLSVADIAEVLGCTWRTVQELVSRERAARESRGEDVSALRRPAGRPRRA